MRVNFFLLIRCKNLIFGDHSSDQLKLFLRPPFNRENFSAREAWVKILREMGQYLAKFGQKEKSKQYDRNVKQWYNLLENAICRDPNSAKFHGYVKKKLNV